MKDIGSLCHPKWECKYHVVFIPKYRRKALYYELRQYLGQMFHELACLSHVSTSLSLHLGHYQIEMAGLCSHCSDCSGGFAEGSRH